MIKQATAKLCLDTRGGQESVGRSLKVRVTFDRKSRYYPVKTKDLLTYAEFASARSKTAKTAIAEAAPCVTAASGICAELGSFFDWDVFSSRYREWYENSRTVSSGDTFSSLMNEYLEMKPLAVKTGESYRIAASWMERFCPGARLCDIDVSFMMRLNAFIRKAHDENEPISENSIRNYFRTYRALMNFAIKTGRYKESNPVAEAYNGSLASTSREKGALTEKEFLSFKNYVPADRDEEFSKDFWFAVIAMSGANVGDILKLRNRNIQGDRIVFVRTKSKRNGLTINIPLAGYLVDFFNKYGRVCPGRPDDYILCFLAGTKGEKGINSRIHAVIRRINEGLKTIFSKLGIDKAQAVSYSARHTFSVLALSSGISHGELQKFLGHASVTTTERYLRSITSSSIEKDRSFIDGLLK